MAFRFRRSVKIAPGLRVNFGKRGVSLSGGVRGASITVGSRGTYGNVGIPGTGLSYRSRIDGGKQRRFQEREQRRIEKEYQRVEKEQRATWAHSHFPGYAAGTGLCVFAICFKQFQRPAL